MSRIVELTRLQLWTLKPARRIIEFDARAQEDMAFPCPNGPFAY
jgi:hypothetical protein